MILCRFGRSHNACIFFVFFLLEPYFFRMVRFHSKKRTPLLPRKENVMLGPKTKRITSTATTSMTTMKTICDHKKNHLYQLFNFFKLHSFISYLFITLSVPSERCRDLEDCFEMTQVGQLFFLHRCFFTFNMIVPCLFCKEGHLLYMKHNNYSY